MRINLLTLLFVTLFSTAAFAYETRTVETGVYNMQWLPDGYKTSDKKYPLVIFSHGFGGCPQQSKFLTRALADAGYIVMAPKHADARCTLAFERPQVRFRNPDKWSDTTYADRRADVVGLVDQALKDPVTAKMIDVNKIAIAGHSLGGYTALGVGGGWKTWRDKRFKVVLALSPFADPYITHKTLGDIKVPVMYQGGTKDWGVTPSLKQEGGGGYAQTPAPKYFVNFDGAHHFAFSDRGGEHHTLIVEYALAFLDKYMRGIDAPLLTATPPDGVKEFRSAEK